MLANASLSQAFFVPKDSVIKNGSPDFRSAMTDKSARQIIKGKVGDRYEISENYGGKWNNAIAVPLDNPRGPAKPIPAGDGPPKTTVIERPDFRKTDKNKPVFSNNQ